MPLWEFIALELGIIIVEALIIKFVPWSKIRFNSTNKK